MSLMRGEMGAYEDPFYNYDYPMFNMVDPNDVLQVGPPQMTSFNGRTCFQNLPPDLVAQEPPVNHIDQENFLFQQQPITFVQEQSILPTELQQQSATSTLAVQEDSSAKVKLHQQLQRLSEKRRERLKARVEQEPAVIQTRLNRKSTDKKMTSRERQIELERQEAQQLQLKDQLLELISTLEQKCNKLREILENIVTTSPEYNAQMISFLESSELLFDQQQQQQTNCQVEESSNSTRPPLSYG